MTNTETLTANDVPTLYAYWLQSKSLRAIAKMVTPEVSHSTIAVWFRKHYGDDATNPEVNSLARSLLEDYQGDQATLEYVLANLGTLKGDVKHRSLHSLQMLTQYQTPTKEGVLEYIAVDSKDYLEETEAPTWSFLRLPWVLTQVDLWVKMLSTDSQEVDDMGDMTLEELQAIIDGLETLIADGHAENDDSPIVTAHQKTLALLGTPEVT